MKSALILVCLLFTGCMGWDGRTIDVNPGALSFNNRIQRWAQVFLGGLDFDSNGSQGILTTICTPGYVHHGCTVNCTWNGRDHAQATLSCPGDGSTPTGFTTVLCGSDDFAQGYQGTATVTITPSSADSVRTVLSISGTMYILDRAGNYLTSGIWDQYIDATLVFTQRIGQPIAHTCESGTSTITVQGEGKSCSSLAFPVNC